MAARKKTPPPKKPAARKPVITVVGEAAPPAAPPPLSWSDWYNQAAPNEQTAFDRAAEVIDAGGEDDRKLRGETPYVEAFRGTVLYLPLLDYEKTGGRLAMFFEGKRVYGKTPITGVKTGGPVELVGGKIVMHPGLYSYTNVPRNGTAFTSWLEANPGSVKVLRMKPSSEVDPYFTDYSLLVSADTEWTPDTATYGSPTWLPPGTVLLAFWSKTDPEPNSDLANIVKALKEGASGIGEVAKSALTVMTILGVAYIAHEMKPSRSAG